MKKYAKFPFFVALYAAFVLAAYGLRQHVVTNSLSEVWGWDYQTFLGQIADWRWIAYTGFRHPGLGLVMSPLVVFQHVWFDAYLWVMPAVATATAWLIWRMSGWIGLGVWLAMPATWILAGVPESFPVAQLALVGSVWWNKERPFFSGSGKDSASPLLRTGLLVVGWCALNAMITLTNGVKPVLGWVALHGRELDRKVIVRGWLVVAGAVLLGVGFFYVRTVMTGRGMGAGIEATLSWIPNERNLLRELYGFFVRPVGLWQAFVVYPLALLGGLRSVRAHHIAPLLLITSYFAVDILIHGIVGWGMLEPWVFAPHWIWMLPLLAGQVVGSGK